MKLFNYRYNCGECGMVSLWNESLDDSEAPTVCINGEGHEMDRISLAIIDTIHDIDNVTDPELIARIVKIRAIINE